MKLSCKLWPLLLSACLLSGSVLAGELPGTLAWGERMSMGTLVSGVVSEVPVKPGQRVGKGDLLVGLDARGFRAGLTGARAELARAKARLEEAQREEEEADQLRSQADELERSARERREKLISRVDGLAYATEIAAGRPAPDEWGGGL